MNWWNRKNDYLVKNQKRKYIFLMACMFVIANINLILVATTSALKVCSLENKNLIKSLKIAV